MGFVDPSQTYRRMFKTEHERLTDVSPNTRTIQD